MHRPSRAFRKPARAHMPRLGALAIALLGTQIGLVGATGDARAQGWGADEVDPPPTPSPAPPPPLGGTTTAGPPITPWAFRVGAGFSIDPDNFLLSFELPYRFDRYVSVGPMVQLGLGEDRVNFAPSMNLTLTLPGLPGEGLERVQPNVFGGIGFALIENDDRGGDTRSVGFLGAFGVGLDYVLSDRVTVGSRMIFNFLPEQTLEENFFYSWEMLGVRLHF